ncbi:GFA family protein [Altererythrobacter sp. CC-YST694]|uniref:GFA family protein n=1 Tax=Altererythrobacter sp. CC-YST694 TaxID=2755038 RepID=UPI001D0346EB|nr:GFA family protein [Altererythrobacter sp. CC-YST694]MCB5424674.1 GFA family protein [Altererythrobacter sp. CC-YST694]
MDAQAEWKLPWTGGCRCGAVRFEVVLAPLLASVCHCFGCQRMSASAFSTTLTIPQAGFRLSQGTVVTGGVHGAAVHHHHCDACKSWVFTTLEPEMGFVNLRATMLDEASWFEPYAEMQLAERLPWVATPARRSFERFPKMEEYAGLIAEFAEHGKRP